MATKDVNKTNYFSPDRNHLIVSQIKNSIVIIIVMTAIIYKIKQMGDLPFWVAPAIIGGMHCIFLPLLISVRHSINRRKYSFEDDKIVSNMGLFKTKTIEIKYKDIRSISLSRDLLERLFKIKRINISTSNKKLIIKGLKNTKADEIKNIINEKMTKI